MNSPKNAAIRLQDAIHLAPTLAQLSQRASLSTACLSIVRPLLPPGLRAAVRAGGIDSGEWCLLVPHNAAAAKLRQLAPAMLAALRTAEHDVNAIRVKVERAGL